MFGVRGSETVDVLRVNVRQTRSAFPSTLSATRHHQRSSSSTGPTTVPRLSTHRKFVNTHQTPPSHHTHHFRHRRLFAQEQLNVTQLVRSLFLTGGHHGIIPRCCRCLSSRHHFTHQLADNRISFMATCLWTHLVSLPLKTCSQQSILVSTTKKEATGDCVMTGVFSTSRTSETS